MSVQILFRRGTAANWTTANPILGNGEPGFETDTGRLKIGDGSSSWNSLSYVEGTGGGTNTTYTLSAELNGSNADIRLTGSDASTDTVTIAAGNNISIERTDANTITISSTDTGAIFLQDLGNVSATTPELGQVLKWDGSIWAPGTDLNDGSGSVALNDVTDVVLTSPTSGQVLKFDGANWVNDTDATGGSSITSLNDVPDVVLTSPTSGQVLKFDGVNWVNGTDLNDGTGSLALGDLTNVSIAGATTGQVLKFDGANWTASDEAGGSSNLVDLDDVVVLTPSVGQVLKWNGSAWVNETDNTATVYTRNTVFNSTGTIADDASSNVDLSGYKSYALLKIETSAAAWVRIYTDAASRTSDESRLQGTDPLPGAGVIAEVVTTGAETVIITPGTIGFNNESPVTNSIPLRVTNLSGSSADITVTLTVLQLEA